MKAVQNSIGFNVQHSYLHGSLFVGNHTGIHADEVRGMVTAIGPIDNGSALDADSHLWDLTRATSTGTKFGHLEKPGTNKLRHSRRMDVAVNLVPQISEGSTMQVGPDTISTTSTRPGKKAPAPTIDL